MTCQLKPAPGMSGEIHPLYLAIRDVLESNFPAHTTLWFLGTYRDVDLYVSENPSGHATHDAVYPRFLAVLVLGTDLPTDLLASSIWREPSLDPVLRDYWVVARDAVPAHLHEYFDRLHDRAQTFSVLP